MPVSPSTANANGYNPAVFVPGLGFRVTKTEDLSGTGDDLFTVTGKVLVTAIFGEVTNSIDAAVVDWNMLVSGVGTNIFGADFSTLVVGDVFCLTTAGNFSSPNQKFSLGDVAASLNLRLGLAGGSLTLVTTHTAGDAGDAILWTLYYLPLEPGASVAAAA